MKDSQTVDNFMTQVMSVVNQLRRYGEDLLDQCVIEKLLRGLPKKFEAVGVPRPTKNHGNKTKFVS